MLYVYLAVIGGGLCYWVYLVYKGMRMRRRLGIGRRLQPVGCATRDERVSADQFVCDSVDLYASGASDGGWVCEVAINPATGYPMFGGFDIESNPYGLSHDQ